MHLPLLVLSTAVFAADLPQGQVLEVRLETPTGTRTSKAGDPVRARLVGSVIVEGKPVIPAGSIVAGRVTSVDKFGWGIKKANAKIGYLFDRIEIPGADPVAIDARVVQVDTARERVDEIGIVHGIAPTVSSSSALAVYAWRLVILEPVVGSAVWATKFLFASAPDLEITYPAGTEMLLKIAVSAAVPTAPVSFTANFGPTSLTASQEAVERLPEMRVRRKSGEEGDRLNLFFLADEKDLRSAFTATGWVGAEKRSPKSLFRMYLAVTKRQGRRTAPVAPMRWSGELPDLVFQKSLNTFARRHHLRLWRTSNRIEGKDVWVGSATEDVHIGYSWSDKRWVHRIDEDIDNERAKVLADLLYTGCVTEVDLIASDVPVHGGVRTDGKLAAARFSGCATPREMPLAPPIQRATLWASAITGLGKDFARTNLVTLGLATARIGPVAKAFLAGQKDKVNERSQITGQQTAWLNRKAIPSSE